MKRSLLPLLGLSLLVAIVYFLGAELGLSLATLHENVTPVGRRPESQLLRY